MRAEAALALAALFGACDAQTLVDVKIVPPAGQTIDRLTVNVFEERGLVASRALERPRLPGTLSVRLKDVEQDVRLVGVATPAALGAVKVRTSPRGIVTAELRLGLLPDADGDGVPDLVDVCPTVADPSQASAQGGAPGDACGAESDGGVDGGVSVDAGLGGPSKCPVAGALWCEGFEGTLAGYPVQEENGTVRIGTGTVARGNGALVAEVPNRSVGYAFTTARNESVIGAEDDWVLRAFVQVPSTAPARGAAMLSARYSGDYSNVSVGMSTAGRFQLERTLGGQVNVSPSAKSFPLDQWVCVELVHVRRNGRVALRVFLDGVEEPALAQSDLPVPNRFDQVLVGMSIPPAGGGGGAAALVDEVLVTSNQVGCGR